MPKSCSKKPKSFTLQRQGKGNEEKTYIQVALELTLVKEFGPFLGVHSKNMDFPLLFSLGALQSTCPLVFGCCELSHVIYLILRKIT